MESQKIYLSPLKILSYLCDLEAKIPMKNTKEYITDCVQISNNDDLNREAKKMLEFVGLYNCVPDCAFDITPENTAGSTVNNNSLQSIDIKVSNTYVRNKDACLAILAHEICHKVIFLNGIDFPNIPIYTEIFTDLCTIYVGFGQLVVKGNITKSACYENGQRGEMTHFLGYLKYEMYLHALFIVNLCRGGYNDVPAYYVDGDLVLKEAVEKWKNTTDVHDFLKSRFMEDERIVSQVCRNMLLLPQLFEQVFTKHKAEIIKMSDKHKSLGTFSKDDDNDKKILRFKTFYTALLEEQQDIGNTEVLKSLNDLIVTLTDKYDDIDLAALSYDKLKCPCCGSVVSIKGIIDRDTIIKCKSCGHYFRFCNSYVNITKLRREQQKNKKNDDSRIASDYQKAFNDGYYATNSRYRKLVDNLPWWIKLFAGGRFPKNL